MTSTLSTAPSNGQPSTLDPKSTTGFGPVSPLSSSHHSIASASGQSRVAPSSSQTLGNAPATQPNTVQPPRANVPTSSIRRNLQQRNMKTARDSSAEMSRIQVERIWADRIEKELQMQRAFPKDWGFLVGKAAVQGPASSQRVGEPEAFTVKSILHPPARLFHAPTRPASSPKKPTNPKAGSMPTVPINQHTNPITHHYQSVYKSAFTPAVFTFHAGSRHGLPDRFAALPNKKELRQATRTIAIQQRQQQQQEMKQPEPPTQVPPTSNSEYGWRFPGTTPLERFGSTSANYRQAYAQGSQRDGGLLPAARKPKVGSNRK